MKRTVFALAASLCVFAGAAEARAVRVTLNNVEARGGNLLAALQTSDQFLKGPGAYNVGVPATAGTVTLEFPDVAPGDYAFALMHDEDADNQMKMDPQTQAPLEGWALSNGDALTGPPTFDQVKFTVPDTPDDVSIVVNMHYPYVPPAATGR
ncbi:MAG TPA: DUF2141 domain-containing protein [Caulobacterales bacterium]|nr:DUF2141 domain-containing protein [Caulobacterales bacterium]